MISQERLYRKHHEEIFVEQLMTESPVIGQLRQQIAPLYQSGIKCRLSFFFFFFFSLFLLALAQQSADHKGILAAHASTRVWLLPS